MASTERPEQLGQLPTEARNPRSEHLDELSTVDMLTVINDEDATIAATVRAALPQIAAAVDEIALRFADGGRLFYIGAGTSGRLGVLDASECPPTFSVSPDLFVGLIAGGDSALRKSSEQSEDSAEAGVADLLPFGLTRADTVLGIAASGRTPYVLGGLAHANEQGAFTIALTCAGTNAADHEPSRMAHLAELAIELATGPEVLTGSTRMKAGTATKLVLNMISTGVMVRTGAVFGNLVDRAHRIIAAGTGCDMETATKLLAEGGSVKNAILMQRLGLAAGAALARLELSGGSLREALKERGSQSET
jgi:N-acetylmuramic acid 6-phosphate etherase